MLKGLVLQNRHGKKNNISLTADDFNYQNFNETLLNLSNEDDNDSDDSINNQKLFSKTDRLRI